MNTDNIGCSETMAYSKATQYMTFQTQTILDSASCGAAYAVGDAWRELKQLTIRIVQNLSKSWSLFSLSASAQ